MEAVLTKAELDRVTGYTRHAEQLRELLKMGFWRARRSKVTGAVILERAHYEAVCRGERQPAGTPSRRPQLQPV